MDDGDRKLLALLNPAPITAMTGPVIPASDTASDRPVITP